MKAVLFTANKGTVTVEEVPSPQLGPGQVLVRNQFSLLSAGTERTRIETGQQSLLAKARSRPDQVRQVLASARTQGLAQTWSVVQDRLDAPAVMGYSCSGVALEVGSGVENIRAGQLVACAGGGYANHAEIVCIPRNLCVPLPEGVDARQGAFATVGAIALQGIHQAGVTAGSRVAVIGLGLVGQLTARILIGYGYQVVGVDADESMVRLAGKAGVSSWVRDTDDLVKRVDSHWGGGADAVIVTAGTRSGDPVALAGQLARDRATVVIVGDSAVTPPRPPYYQKELTITYSRSYGPGRYDPEYEEGGIAYPEGFVPWDERRNLAEVLRLIGEGRLDIDALDPVVYSVDDAALAYKRLSDSEVERRVAILLTYPDRPTTGVPSAMRIPDVGYSNGSGSSREVAPSGAASAGRSGLLSPYCAPTGVLRVGALGAGSFATKMLFPSLKAMDEVSFSWLSTASGVSAFYQGRRWGFKRAVSGLEEGLAAEPTDAAMVLSRHESHARLAADVLGQGIGLFCEKPLALSEEELETVAEAWSASGAPAMVGFNRRFAPALTRLANAVRGHGPFQVVYRVHAGRLSPNHWYFDPAQGGRILGEVCHFVDTAGFLVGARPVSVVAHSPDGPDPVRAQSVSAMITYEDGSTAMISYGGATPPGAPKEYLEVAGDGVAGRIDDFRRLQVWGGRVGHRTWRQRGKGHSEEMAGWIELLRGGRPNPAADFISSLWSTLATCRLADAVRSSRPTVIDPGTPCLAAALGGSRTVADE